MGKYMRKAKVLGEVAVMEVSAQSSLGVRTRARTLALQRLQKPSPPPDSSSYLELRSRRLEKPPPLAPKGSPAKPNPPHHRTKEANTASLPDSDKGMPEAEVSSGENVLEAEARDRSVRETTPCSLIRDSETIGTPGSTTRPTSSTATNRRMHNSMRRNIPTAHEMEEFFAGAELRQQRIFIEKYNFDPVNDHPLPGRYEWVELDS
ncbi:cyclin-dependent kinase inhibitor 4 [Elaeis guineensis]|uniref:Cyclin-dependent kinase inhibitor n=1 Tax=Elaeis guineensis var. tenera TaxID=51953 RepID=A0A6I9R659_ELAGV|nr:cyclin-dependent kinase inhibitor 4 [Elaeis guineensis]